MQDRSRRARNESLFAAIIASIGFIFISTSCQPVWSKRYDKFNQLPQPEISNVCINVSEDTREDVINAVLAWDNSIKIWQRLVPVIGGHENCKYQIKQVIPDDDTSILVLAKAFLYDKEIHLYTDRYEKDVIGIVLHEIGHLLGAKHMEGTLMAPIANYNKYKCPDAATVAQVARANGINPLLFQFCVNRN